MSKSLASACCSLALVAAWPSSAGVFAKSDDIMYEPYIIVHPPGYAGVGGELALKVCPAQGSETVIPSLQEAIEIWNTLSATTGNCQGNCLLWEDPMIPEKGFSMSSALLHELGHCAFGLGHVNQSDMTSFTNSRDEISIDPGVDAVRGSSDDIPFPLPGTRVLHWFRKTDNDPFVIDATVIDTNTFTRRILDFPSGHFWPASGNRAVGDLLGLSGTQAVMYDLLNTDQVYTGLTADDVNTVKYGMAGLDSLAGTSDDYTVRLVFQTDCATADIQVEFGSFPFTDFAACFNLVELIQTIHYRVVHDSLLFNRLTIQVESSVPWGLIFEDDFESGDLSAWSSNVP